MFGKNINTIAIVPGSMTSYIPKENKKLFKEIQRRGLVLAEFSKDTNLTEKCLF